LDAGVPGNVASGAPFAPLSENMLRLAYAAALVRMVNGAVDPSQKGKYAAPVMTLAKRMGIPAVLVDVRMAASHQEMPALALLRHASERALQWLFERYWHAQANQLRELRRGAQRAAEDLVRAEAARRVKAERANAFRKAERGKGKAKTRARNGGVHVEDEDENEDEDDDSSGGEDDDAIREKQNDDVEGADGASRDARRTATNRLFAAASREDTETCAEALLSVALDVSRAPDGEPPGSSPTLEDWRAVASRLLKRWPTLDEAMLLKAADAALEPGSPSSEHLVAAATDLGDARARGARGGDSVRRDVFVEDSKDTAAGEEETRFSARRILDSKKVTRRRRNRKKTIRRYLRASREDALVPDAPRVGVRERCRHDGRASGVRGDAGAHRARCRPVVQSRRRASAFRRRSRRFGSRGGRGRKSERRERQNRPSRRRRVPRGGATRRGEAARGDAF
jgi:hypothetical protein